MHSAVLHRSMIFVLALGCVVRSGAHAQTFAATTGTEAVINIAPTSPVDRVNVPGKHRGAEETQLFGHVRDGVYTVDGMVAKVRLNYDLNGVTYLTLFFPGLGTAVVSTEPAPNTVVSEAKLKESELSFTVGEHRFQLTGVALASNRGTIPAHLYVRLDREAWQLGRRPMVGFGNLGAMPYQWPGALATTPAAHTEETEVIPPVPASLLPSTHGVVPRAALPAGLHPVSLQQ